MTAKPVAQKTLPTEQTVESFLDGVEPLARRDEAIALLDLFRRRTGLPAVMWGPSIVGFGAHNYRYASGRTGSSMRVGFSPRKANMVVYLAEGFDGYDELLGQLGPVTHGKSCLHLKKFAQIDLEALGRLIAASHAVRHPAKVDNEV